jgi:hypothetical protein
MRWKLRGDGGAILICLAFAVYATWPVTRHISTRVPQNLIDPLDNTWIFGWVAYALRAAPLHLFDANMFAPQRAALAYSENLLGMAVPVSPVFWLTQNAILTANIGLLLTYAAGAFATYLLVVEMAGSRGAGLISGAAFGVAPYRVDAIVHPHVVGVHLVPIVLLLALRLHRAPTPRRTLALALAIALQFWTSLTGGILAVVALGAWAAWTLFSRRRSALPALGAGAAALALAVVLSVPVVLPYVAVRRTHPESLQPPSEVVDMSATPASYLLPVGGGRLAFRPSVVLRNRFWGGYGTWEKQLFPGFVLAGAWIFAAVLAIRRWRRVASPVLMLAGVGLAGFALSLGPRLPGAFVLSRLSGGSLRVPARFGTLVIFSLAAIVGVVFATLSRRTQTIAVCICMAGLALELYPPALHTAVPPPLTGAHRAVAAREGAVLALPTAEYLPDHSNLVLGTELGEPRQLYLSTAHFRPMTNGYGSFFPSSYWRFIQAVQDFPSDVGLSKARDRDVRTVVVQTDLVRLTRWRHVADRLDAWPGIRLVARGRGVRVYDISSAVFNYQP